MEYSHLSFIWVYRQPVHTYDTIYLCFWMCQLCSDEVHSV
jgi:hypothetical protein